MKLQPKKLKSQPLTKPKIKLLASVLKLRDRVIGLTILFNYCFVSLATGNRKKKKTILGITIPESTD